MERLAADAGEQILHLIPPLCAFSKNRLGWFEQLTSVSTDVDGV